MSPSSTMKKEALSSLRLQRMGQFVSSKGLPLSSFILYKGTSRQRAYKEQGKKSAEDILHVEAFILILGMARHRPLSLCCWYFALFHPSSSYFCPSHHRKKGEYGVNGNPFIHTTQLQEAHAKNSDRVYRI